MTCDHDDYLPNSRHALQKCAERLCDNVSGQRFWMIFGPFDPIQGLEQHFVCFLSSLSFFFVFGVLKLKNLEKIAKGILSCHTTSIRFIPSMTI